MNSIRRCYNVYYLNSLQKSNLNHLIKIFSTSIDTENKHLLLVLINNWNDYHKNISIENNYDYILNNSNQLNHINFLIVEAKYIVNNKE